MPEIYLIASEVQGKPGMPANIRGTNRWMNSRPDDEWPVLPRMRKASGRGRPAKELHISCFPQETQLAVLRETAGNRELGTASDSTNQPEQQGNTEDREELWQRYANAKTIHKKKAEHRLALMHQVEELIAGGMKKDPAYKLVARDASEDWKTLQRWYRLVEGKHRHDWLPLLVPDYRGGRPTKAIDERALNAFIKLYYRPEKPALSTVHRKLVLAGEQQGIEIPSAKRLRKAAERKIPIAQRVYLREGEAGLMELYPKQERTVADLHALDWINGDGYQHNVFVEWPDGEVKRPTMWVWQDVYSRMIVGWAVDRSENTDVIRKAFLNMANEYGLPNHILLDNTHAANNQELMGGVTTRRRFQKPEDQPLGAWPVAGIACHTTSVSEEGMGYAWAKPTERAFGKGGLGAIIDQDYSLRGAYTGPNPMDKPSNYGSKPASLDQFLDAVERGIKEYNAQPGRRTEMAQGEFSFEQVFKTSYEVTPVTWPTRQQLRLFENSSEGARVFQNGTVTIKAGQKVGKGMRGNNRYKAEELLDVAGQKVRVWFDPQDLHGTVDIYSQDGRFICEADCIEKSGFADREKKREHGRSRTAWIRHNKKAAKQLDRMEDLEAEALLSFDAPEPIDIDKRLVRPFKPADETITRKRHEQTLSPEEQADIAEKIVQLNTEHAELARKSELVDRSNMPECIRLYGKLVAKDSATLNEEQQRFTTWFEEESDYMHLYEALNVDVDFADGGLPRGRTTGPK